MTHRYVIPDREIDRLVAEVRCLDNLPDIAEWMMGKLPGAFALLREIGGPKQSLPMSARVTGVSLYAPRFIRTMRHSLAFSYLGLPVGKPGERVPIFGYGATLVIQTVGGSWWHPLILRRLGLFPNPHTNFVTTQALRYRVILRADEWPQFVVMQRLKGEDDGA